MLKNYTPFTVGGNCDGHVRLLVSLEIGENCRFSLKVKKLRY